MDNLKQIQKKLLACIRKADYEFGLINDGDKILIGLSGGKDSLALVTLLSQYQKFRYKKFEIACCHIDFGFPSVDFSKTEEYIKSLGVRYISYPSTEVFDILKAHRNSKGLLPCSICSRMRKAVINKVAKELGFKKVAFAHHMDDAIETLFLNMTFGARVATFEPMMYLSNAGIDFIRPLIYAREEMIRQYVLLASMPVSKNSCGNDKHTQREDIKLSLAEYYKGHPDAYSNFAQMLTNADVFKLWFNNYGSHLDNGLTVKKCLTREDIIKVAAIAIKNKDTGEETFTDKDVFYYLLSRGDKYLAYMRIKNPTSDFTYYIQCLSKTDDCKEEDCLELIHTFENNISTRHVPCKVFYQGEDNFDPFINSGYIENCQGFYKSLTKPVLF